MMRDNSEYVEWLKSDDVVDEIIYGRREYPVVDLCIQGEFGLAYDMLKKGYHCIHNASAEDVIVILRSVLTKNQKLTSKEEVIPYILEKLAVELDEMESSEYSQLVGELGEMIAKSTKSIRRQSVFSIMRNSLPNLYQSLVAFNTWNVWQLMMFDKQFVEDYIISMQQQGCLHVLSCMDESDEEKFDEILLTLLRMDDLDLVKQCSYNILHIFSECFEVQPVELACDIAIISAMKEMSLVVATLPEHYPQLGTELFTTNGGISGAIYRLELRLRSNMREGYNLEHVNAILKEYKKDEIFIDHDENVEKCAEYVFEEVKSYCRGAYR